jgi:hypothetical protein
MAFPLPTVIPKTRTVNLAGPILTKERLGYEITVQTKADLHAMLVGITTEEVEKQERIGNPPNLVEVDNRTNKPLDQVQRKVVVLFGVHLARAAMRMAETELSQAINASTTARSGRLSNVSANWEWVFIPNWGAARVVTSANPPTTFQRGDQLVLRPVRVPYASAVNRAVANAGRLNQHLISNIRGKQKARLAKSAQNRGFLGAATWILKRRPEFAEFRVAAIHTTSYAVAGEGRKHGTGIILITPRVRRR